jgi:hypothetical protein
MTEHDEEIRSFVADRVAEGFASEAEIVESATEHFEYETGQTGLGPEVARITAEEMGKHLRAQRLWARPTDCDRLDWAFAELDRAGIVARQNFTCCSTCGHHEIWDEIEQTKTRRRVEGYVFYHMQDTESAFAGGGLFLAYGAVKEGEEALIAVGEKIVLALERAGLRTEWNGNGDRRIQVVGLDWKRFR